MEKRKWFYLQRPKIFGMPPCACGNADTEWSEYKNHLWCEKCQKDFIPAHNGVFDGPIPIGASALLGISFDRFNIETQRVERFDIELPGLYENAV